MNREVNNRVLFHALCCFAMTLALGACGDDAPDTTSPPGNALPDGLPLVSLGDVGQDQCVTNLVDAFESLDLSAYEQVLGEDFLFRFDAAEAPILGSSELSRHEDLESTERMFNGETGLERERDSSGNWTGNYRAVPAVRSIAMGLDPATGSGWEAVTEGEFAGSFRRVFRLDMTVTYAGNPRIDVVYGVQIMYLTEGLITIQGTEVEVWRLRAWEDQGTPARPARRGSEDLSVGWFKSRY